MMEAGLEEEEPSILVIVIDADPTSWQQIHVAGERARAGDPSLPASAQTLITFPHLLDTVLVFIDAYLLTHRANRVAVVATLPDRSEFLYPPPPPPLPPSSSSLPLPVLALANGKSSSSHQDDAKPAAANGPAAGTAAAAASAAPPAASLADRVGQAVVEGLRRLLASTEAKDEQENDDSAAANPSSEMDQDTNGQPSSSSSSSSTTQKQTKKKQSAPRKQRCHGSLISQALSKGLCYIQRIARESSLPFSSSSSSSPLAARMLVLQASPDVHGDYNAFMNCIFSAHRSSVPIDAAVLSLPPSLHPFHTASKDSSFLQQASYITGGIYIRPDRPSALLQYFLHLFLPSHRLRQVLTLPKQESVDFRAACFCHRRAVEQAYVCSVCLSIFCAFAKECATCGTPCRPPKGGGGGGGGKRGRE